MDSIAQSAGGPAAIELVPVAPVRALPGLREDVARGFAARPRWLPPKYFYDSHGSELFERICATPEYYPSRAESQLLREHAAEIIARARPEHLIELGSGSCRKTRLLLRTCPGPVHFWPFDVCAEMLERAAGALLAELPGLRVTALLGDYLGGLSGLPQPPGRRLYLFLGGTLGNFTESEAAEFLGDLRRQMRAGDALLLGADRLKAPARLQAAYDDAAGVTAEFNLNVLRVINRELEADFELGAFYHQAVFNPSARRIEMYLVSRREQWVRVAALSRRYRFARGERLLTEISRKFSATELTASLERAGFEVERHFQGGEELFSLLLARAR